MPKLEKICKRLIKNFIITGQYCKPSPEWPKGKGSVIVLSKVKIYRHTESESEPIGTKMYQNYVYSGKGKHPELEFCENLGSEIRKPRARAKIDEITAHLVQNFSPCWKCAMAIVNLKNKHEVEDGIKFSLTIEFANFYRHWVEPNINGLQMLSRNGVTLTLLHGEEKWRAFLDDKRLALSEEDKKELLRRAMSDERKRNEKNAVQIYRKLRLGNTTQPSSK